MEYQYTKNGAARVFLYGAVTLEIGTDEFPVHRDLMFQYAFFRNLPGDTRKIKMDPAIVTTSGLDAILCLEYPDCRTTADIFREPVTWAEALVAWEFFGGPDSVGVHFDRKLDERLGYMRPQDFDSARFPEGLDDLLVRHNFNTTRIRLARLKAASTPEGQARLEAHVSLERRQNEIPWGPEPDTMTIKQLQYECRSRTAKRRLKSELVDAVEIQRADRALEELLAACLATQEEREEVYRDIMAVGLGYGGVAYRLLPDGAIYKVTECIESSVVPGPEHIRRHFFWGCGLEHPFYLNQPCAISTDLEVLRNLRNRIKQMFM